ncbi:MAG: Fur family transcriptional regulator, partial [Solirubrobacteraceae bacterium]
EIQKSLDGLCDRVTIYRVLERLMEEGVIHKIVNVDGVVKYAGCHSCSEKHHHNHIHFSCQKCKSVTCLEDVKPSFKLPENYIVSEVNFTLSGLCPQCS